MPAFANGFVFSVPVTLRIPFDPTQVANDAAPALYQAEIAGTFASLPTTVNGNFLETTITNFSWVMPASPARAWCCETMAAMTWRVARMACSRLRRA